MKRTVTSKQYFTTVSLTYYMQAFTVLAFAGVVAFLISQNQIPPGDNNTWMSIVSLSLISGLGMAYFVFRYLLKKMDKSLPLQQRMPRYARALLVRSSLIELPGLMASISAYIAGNMNFLAISVLIFVIFLILKPSRNSVAMDLNLSPKEKALLENDDAIVSEVN
jgi:hypothetical protein